MSTNALLQVTEATPDHALGRCGGAVLYLWRGTTTVRAARRLQQLVEEARAEAGGGPGVLLGVVTEGAAPPDADARDALAVVLGGGAGFVDSSALVCEGSGFRASMVRGIATGLTLIARPPFPHKVFADVAAAAEWLEARARRPASAPFHAEEIAAQVAALREAVASGPIHVDARLASAGA